MKKATNGGEKAGEDAPWICDGIFVISGINVVHNTRTKALRDVSAFKDTGETAFLQMMGRNLEVQKFHPKSRWLQIHQSLHITPKAGVL